MKPTWRISGTDTHGRPIYTLTSFIGTIGKMFPAAFDLLKDGPVVLMWSNTTAPLFPGMTADEWFESWSLRREAYQRGAPDAARLVVHSPEPVEAEVNDG